MGVFFLGVLLSFWGQLPLGTMSITATQIAVTESFRRAWKYAFGVAIVEVLYLRLVLFGVNYLAQYQAYLDILNWISVGVFLLVGIATIVFALRNKTARKPLVLSNNLDRFLLGLSMSALNPIQIPFWFAWSTFFIERGWMSATPLDNNIFSIGCGLGTLAGLALYMYGGHWLVTKLHASQRTLNLIMGGVFLFAAAALAYKQFAG